MIAIILHHLMICMLLILLS